MTRDLLDFDPKCQSLQYLHLLKTIYVLCDFYFKLLVNPGFSCGDRFWKIRFIKMMYPNFTTIIILPMKLR